MPRQFLVQPDTELTAIFTPNSEEPIVCGRARAYERWSHPSSECARPAAAPERDGRGSSSALTNTASTTHPTSQQHLSSRRAASARPPAFPCPSCHSASRRGCRGLTSRRTHHAGDEGLDLGRGLLTVIDQVGTLRRFDGTRRIGSRSAGGLPRSFRGADRSVVAGVSALPHRHHGGDRLHRADQTLPAGSGYIMTRDRDPARTNSNCPPGCVRSQS
jgi:hypothetical protein